MKLRISERTVRFRLSLDDIDSLEANGTLSQSLELSSEVDLTYSLHLKPNQTWTSLSAKPMKLEVVLPEIGFKDWIRSHEIEWTYSQLSPPLEILIEKDLKT